MKRLLPTFFMVLLVGACGGSTPATESPAASTLVKAACTLPAEIAGVIGTPVATATLATFAAVDPNGAAPTEISSPFDGQKFFFISDWMDTNNGRTPDQGGFATGSAGSYVISVVMVRTDKASSGLAVSYWPNDPSQNIKLDGGYQDLLDAAYNESAGLFETSPVGGETAAWKRIGGIAMGADALYYQYGSALAAMITPATPFDFPNLAIAHHPSAASAQEAISYIGASNGGISYCVNGVMTDFVIVTPEAMGIPADQRDLYATMSDGMPVKLAVAAVEIDGQHYVIARGVFGGSNGLVSYRMGDDFQLAAWPSNTISK